MKIDEFKNYFDVSRIPPTGETDQRFAERSKKLIQNQRRRQNKKYEKETRNRLINDSFCLVAGFLRKRTKQYKDFVLWASLGIEFYDDYYAQCKHETIIVLKNFKRVLVFFVWDKRKEK